MLDRLDWEIMNATADDWESLDQILPSVAAFCGPFNAHAVACSIARLVIEGLMEEMKHGAVEPESIVNTPIDYWFRMTSHGRELWSSEAERFAEGV
jgi:hypothetical protein